MAIEAAKLLVTIDANVSGAERDISSFGSKLNNAAKNMGMAGAALTAGVTVPLVAVAGKALSMAADYEQSMSMIQYSTQASAAEMDALGAQALQLGADSVFSAQEVADAQLALAKAGLKSNKIIGAMPGVVNLAAAADMGLAEAAETTTEILSMWGLEVAKSTEVADMLAGAANGTTADVADFTMGIKQSGAVMADYNIPLDDTLTMMGLLANAGLKGSDAGTSLKTMFMMLAAPTDKAAQVMQELGIAIYDGNGAMNSAEDIINNLRSSLSGLSQADRNDAMKNIFGADGMRAASLLMQATGTEWEELNAIINADGNAAGMAEARMKGLAGAVEGLSGSIDTVLLSEATPFDDFLTGIVNKAKDAVDAFGDLSPDAQTMILTIGGLAAAAGPALIALGAVAAAIGAIGLTGMLAILAISGLAAAWATNFGDIQGKTEDAASVISETFAGLSTDVAAFGTALQTAFADGKLGQKLTEAVITLGINLKTEFNISFDAAAAVATMKAKVDTLRDSVLGGLTTAINGIDFTAASLNFAGLVNKVATAVKGIDLSGIDWAGTLTTALLGPLGTAIKGIQWVIGSGEFEGLKTSVITAIGEISWTELGTAFTGLASAITEQLVLIGNDIIADFRTQFTPPPTTKAPAPEFDFKWEDVGKIPERAATSLTNSFEVYPWETTGQVLGAAIVGWWEGELLKIGALMQIPSVINDFNATWGDFNVKIAEEIRKGFDLEAFNVAWGTLKGSLIAGFIEMIGGLTSTLMGAITQPKATPTADILREQSNDFSWSDLIPEPLSWPTFVTALTWANFIGTLSWPTFIGNLSWETFVGELGWGDWIPTLDWGDFVSWLQIPSGGGDGGGGGGGGTGGFQGSSGGGGNTPASGEKLSVTLNVASLNSDLDVESMAQRVAGIIARKMR